MNLETYRHKNYPLIDQSFAVARKTISDLRPSLMHSHDYYELCWIVSGRGLHFINGRVHRLNVDDVLWIRPTDQHAFQSRRVDPLELVNLSVSAELVAGIAGLQAQTDLFWSAATQPAFGKASGPVKQALNQLERFSAQRTTTRLAVAGILMVVIELWNKRSLDVAYSEVPWLAKACRDMNRRATDINTDVPSVHELIERCGRGHEHVCRSMKALLGQTPSQFINGIKCQRATVLLQSTQLPVEEIAFRCGFESVSYFSKVYKKSQGLSPSALRSNSLSDPFGNALRHSAGLRTST